MDQIPEKLNAVQLRELLVKAQSHIDMQVKLNAELKAQVDGTTEKLTAMGTVVSSEKFEELTQEISDLRSKMKNPASVINDADQKLALKQFTIKAYGDWSRQAQKRGDIDLQSFMKSMDDQYKALNISTDSEGGSAVASVLSMDLIEYAIELSPILGQLGQKQGITRDHTELVLISFPSTADGLENVAGTSFINGPTTTQQYAKVKSEVIKVVASPKITDEALKGTTYNVYADLIRLIGREITIKLSTKVLYGDGTDLNSTGMLASARVSIGAGGDSFKPSMHANVGERRPHGVFPVLSTGVSDSLGTDSVAIADYFIALKNSLPTMYLGKASFHFNRNTLTAIEKVRDADGHPLFIASLMEGGAPKILGYPVVIDDTLPNIAAGSTPIIFGDIASAYAMANGDIDYMQANPFKEQGVTYFEYSKEIFVIMQASDAIVLCAITTVTE